MSQVTLAKQVRGVLSNTPIISANQNVLAFKRNLVDTSSGVVTLTLPATPSDNEIIGFLDINGSFNTNNCIINVGNVLHDIQGDTSLTLDLASAYIELQFITSTNSWRLLNTPMPALPVFVETAIQTSNYTSVNLDSVLCDTSGGGFTVTLPATLANGDKVRIVDVANSFSETNPLTVGRNGNNIINLAEDFDLVIGRTSYTFMFVTGQGWLILDNAPNLANIEKSFMYAMLSVNQTTNVTVGDHVKFDFVIRSRGNNITLDTTTAYTNNTGVPSIGRFTVTGGRSYKLSAGFLVQLASVGGNVKIRWTDATNAGVRPLLSISQYYYEDALANTFNNNNNGGDCIISPIVDMVIEATIDNSSPISTLWAPGIAGINQADPNGCTAIIEEI